MKKILKISLFIIVFCLLLILFSNSQVQAVVETITTVQELQEVMGATEHSTIDGTTLKITDNFIWTIPATDIIDLKIPVLTIDFNGKEIKIDQKGLGMSNVISITNGKVILKDSQGETGGIYCNGHFVDVGYGAELKIENGQYIGESISSLYLFQNNGGTITINNGTFKCMNLHYGLFEICSGKMTINKGTFWGKGTIISMTGGSDSDWVKSELIINDGLFSNEDNPLLMFRKYLSQVNIEIKGGEFKSSGSSVIDLMVEGNAYSQSPYQNEVAKLKLDGCELTGSVSALMMSNIGKSALEKWNIDVVNCSMKNTTTYMSTGAIYANYQSEKVSVIKSLIGNYDSDVFETSSKYGNTVTSTESTYTESTYRELVFKDGKLISATGNPNDKENNAENNTDSNKENNVDNNEDNNTENNPNNNAENNIENNTKNNIENNAENDTKLPQTGEETNTFVTWLSVVILLGIFWLGSMLLIDREKKKMTQK